MGQKSQREIFGSPADTAGRDYARSGVTPNHDHLDEIESQVGVTYAKGKHVLRTGVRYRKYREANVSTQGFNGSFTFATLAGYQAFVLGSPQASQIQLISGQSSFVASTGDVASWLRTSGRRTRI